MPETRNATSEAIAAVTSSVTDLSVRFQIMEEKAQTEASKIDQLAQTQEAKFEQLMRMMEKMNGSILDLHQRTNPRPDKQPILSNQPPFSQGFGVKVESASAEIVSKIDEAAESGDDDYDLDVHLHFNLNIDDVVDFTQPEVTPNQLSPDNHIVTVTKTDEYADLKEEIWSETSLGDLISSFSFCTSTVCENASMDYSSYFMMRTNSDSYILVPEMKADDLSVLLRNMNDFNEVESSLLCRLQLRTGIKGVQWCPYVKFVDGNYVFDKGKVHKYSKKNDIDVQMFDGNDLENWLFQLNMYFECYLVPIEQKLAIACVHMTGLAMTGYRWMFRHGKLVSWSSFISAIRQRFGPSSFEDLHDQLSKLSQIGTVSEIVTAFESLADQVLDVQEPILINMFISGLKAEIKRELLMARPRSLFFAFELAREQEAKFKILGGLLKVSSMRPNYSNSSVVSSTIPFQSNSSVVPFTTSNKNPLKNVHRSMSPVRVDKSIDDAQVTSDLASSDKSYMYGKLPTKVFLVDFSLDLGLQNTEVVKEIDGYRFVVPACVRSRSINFCPHGVCQKIHETSPLHSERLGELNEGYDNLHGSEELLVIWVHKPPPLPPENVLKTEIYFEERKFSDLVSSLKDGLYPEEVRTRKPKLLAASINLCAKEADMISKDVLVESLRTLFLQDNLVKVTISELELLITDQFNVLYKPLGESLVESSRKLSKTSFVGTALGSLPFRSCHGEIDDNEIGSNNKMLGRLPTLAESMEEMIYITELCENGSGSLWDHSKPIHVLKLSLDQLKGLVMLAFETAFFILGFSLVDPAFQVCCVNKFYIFSSPRPPEITDLEDKVNFKDGGMLRNGILRDLRVLVVFWYNLDKYKTKL